MRFSFLLALALAGGPALAGDSPASDAAAGLKPILDLAAVIEGGVMRLLGGAPIGEAFAPWPAEIGPMGEGMLAQLRASGVREARVGLLEWSVILGKDAPIWELNASLEPGGPALGPFEARPMKRTIRPEEAAGAWTGGLAPLLGAAEWLAGAMQGPGCAGLAEADMRAMGERIGLEIPALTPEQAAKRRETCALLAGGTDRAIGMSLDDFGVFLLDERRQLVGILGGELTFPAPGQLKIRLEDSFHPAK